MDQARLRPAQVGASTAAAVGAAFLASRLGVYGTIIGVGVITLMSTVGGEMLLRSLERTKQAARTANLRQRTSRTVISAGPAPSAGEPFAEAATEEQPVTALEDAATTEQEAAVTRPDLPLVSDPPPAPALPDDQPSTGRRWPMLAGGFLASFALAMAVIAGIETFTGQSLRGDDGPTVVNVFRGAGQDTDGPPPAPATPTDEPTTSTQQDGTTSQNDEEEGTSLLPDGEAPEQSPLPDDEQPAEPGDETPSPDDGGTPPDEETPEPDEETPPTDDDETPASGEETPAP